MQLQKYVRQFYQAEFFLINPKLKKSAVNKSHRLSFLEKASNLSSSCLGRLLFKLTVAIYCEGKVEKLRMYVPQYGNET